MRQHRRLASSQYRGTPREPARLLILLVLTLSFSACSPTAQPTKVIPITVQLLWTHNAEFAGFYAADQLGFYQEEGLTVTLVEGGFNTDYLSPVAMGTAHFGVAGADELILARGSGKPVVALATIYRRSPSAFVSLVESGITGPQDFIGKTIRVTPQVATHFHAMMARVGISPDSYTEVVLPSSLEAFESGQADVWSVYINNFAVTVQRAGYKLNFIYPDDYGVHFYADTVFTNEDLLTKDPDLVLRFLRASLKGWRYAVENPNAIGLLVQKYAPEADVDLETAKMTAALPLINTGEDFIGWMKPEVWEGMEKTLSEQGIVTNRVDITRVYTLQFLQEIYSP